ncbi:hypothetical protein F4778DRAFT_47872 [Xylariomycetidae sp. FL2044]|nr:hypothetical protein F4778DRAFT_47872 [Xylariomycetidae sp. FL2044]
MSASLILLLRAAPLLFSTSYVTFKYCEDTFLRPFGTSSPASLGVRANRLLPAYHRWWFPQALPAVVVTFSLASVTAVLNITGEGRAVDTSTPDGRVAAGFYVAGAVFSALHFAWGPYDLRILDRLDEGSRDNGAAMDEWWRMNRWRAVTTDIPGFISLFVAFMYAI